MDKFEISASNYIRKKYFKSQNRKTGGNGALAPNAPKLKYVVPHMSRNLPASFLDKKNKVRHKWRIAAKVAHANFLGLYGYTPYQVSI